MRDAPPPQFDSQGRVLHPIRATIEWHPGTNQYFVVVTKVNHTGRIATDTLTFSDGEMDDAVRWLEASFRRAAQATLW